MSVRLATLLLALGCAVSAANAGEIVIDFEQAEIGKPVPTWTDQGVVFRLAGPLAHSKAVGRIMFFPHLATNHKGLVNAMATEQAVPVLATFPTRATAVTVVMWGSTGCPALLEALDEKGEVIAKAVAAAVPGRKKPGDPVPFLTLSVKAQAIAAIRWSGPRDGDFLAADEIRITTSDAK
jgi:hypothetical protein